MPIAAAAPITQGLALAQTGQKRALAGACVAHALHDGFSDLIYVLLPIWQAEFGLAFSALAMLRAV